MPSCSQFPENEELGNNFSTSLLPQYNERWHHAPGTIASEASFLPDDPSSRKGIYAFAEQLMVNLRIVLASYVLNPQTDKLSDGGRLLMKYSKQWLYYFIGLLRNKKIKIRSRTLHSDYLKQISPSAQEISSRWAATRSRKTRSDSPDNKQRSCNCPERQAIWRRKGKLVVPT